MAIWESGKSSFKQILTNATHLILNLFSMCSFFLRKRSR